MRELLILCSLVSWVVAIACELPFWAWSFLIIQATFLYTLPLFAKVVPA